MDGNRKREDGLNEGNEKLAVNVGYEFGDDHQYVESSVRSNVRADNRE